MPRDADPPRVEFLTPDDEDDAPVEPPPPPRRRSRVALLVLAVAVVAVVLVVRVADGGSSSGPTAAPSGASASGPPSATVSTPPAVIAPVTPLLSVDAATLSAAQQRCPRLAPTCTATAGVPAPVAAALRTVPGVRDILGLSTIAYRTAAGPSLAYRRVSATSDTVRIDIEIRAATPADARTDGAGRDAAGRPVTLAVAPAGELVVRVAITALRGPAVPDATANQLADDPRLLTPQ